MRHRRALCGGERGGSAARCSATLAPCADDGTARVWDTAAGAPLQTLVGHSGTVLAVAWSADDTQTLTGGVDGTARIWDVATGALRRTVMGNGSVARVGPSADGRRVVAGNANGSAATWLIDDTTIIADVTRRVCDLVAEGDANGRSWLARLRGRAAGGRRSLNTSNEKLGLK